MKLKRHTTTNHLNNAGAGFSKDFSPRGFPMRGFDRLKIVDGPAVVFMGER